MFSDCDVTTDPSGAVITTLSGRGALALQAVRDGDRVTALAWWRELKREFPPADDRLLMSKLMQGDERKLVAPVPNFGSALSLMAVLAGGTTNFQDKEPKQGE